MSRLRSFTSPRADGSGAPSLRLLAVLAIVAFLVLFAAHASAALLTPPGLSFATGPTSVPGSVAVDQSSGDVYVIDTAGDTLLRFDAEGNPADFSALGTVPGETNVIDGLAGEADATPQGGLTFASEALEFGAGQVAVDNSTGPTAGDVYVTDSGNHVVDIFAPTGAYLGQLGEAAPGEPLGQTSGVAVDPRNGDVYVADLGARVAKYVPGPLEVAPTDADYVSQISSVPGAFGAVGQLAVDSHGNLYTAGALGGPITEYGPTGTKLETISLGSNEAVCAIAVDPADDHLFAVEEPGAPFGVFGIGCKRLVEYDPSGADLGTTALVGPTFGLAIFGPDGDAYIADAAAHRVDRYTAPPPAPPLVGSSSALTVTSSYADVQAQINPNFFDTHFHFEYEPTSGPGAFTAATSTPEADLGSGSAAGASGELEAGSSEVRGLSGQTGNFAVGQPVFAAGIPAAATITAVFPGEARLTVSLPATRTATEVPIVASEAQTASAHLGGLTAATVYRYRVVATNGNGAAVVGPERSFTTPPQSTAEPLSCLNEALRTGFSAALPDCRAYEMVSPADKNGGRIQGINGLSEGGIVQSGADGEKVTYVSGAAFGDPIGAPNGSQYLGARAPDGKWSLQNITIPTSAGAYKNVGFGAPYKAFSTDLSSALVRNFDLINSPSPPLAPDQPAGYFNYYLREAASGSLAALLTTVPKDGTGSPIPPTREEGTAAALQLEAATPDLSRVVLASPAALTPEAQDADQGAQDQNLYEWGGHRFEELDGPGQALEPVNVLPGVTGKETAAADGASLLGSGGPQEHAISDDGSRVFWTHKVNGSDAHLYVRAGIGTSDPHTFQVDASQGGSGSGDEPFTQHGFFVAASSDGSRVFFTDPEALTPRSLAGGAVIESEGAGGDLYAYELEAPLGSRLTDLMPGGEVQGVLGSSSDGDFVYAVGLGPVSDAEPNAAGESPAGGARNLYLFHYDSTDGGWQAPQFIAALSAGPADREDLRSIPYSRTTRVSPDGRHLAFVSEASLTGYDNTRQGGTSCGSTPACPEVYLYDSAPAGPGRLSCASCDPSGARPLGRSRIPAATHAELELSLYQSRVLSADGSRVFFDTADSLVPADTNDSEDVYEYEDGAPHLISGGTSPDNAEFVDADETGKNVFFITQQRLLPSDTDSVFDLYDAREGGGTSPATPPAALCEGDACHPAPTAPDHPTPPTSTSLGAGNPKFKSCPKGKVRKAARCVKKSQAKKHHKKKHHGKKQKETSHNRGGAK
jgi:hypothetical protein